MRGAPVADVDDDGVPALGAVEDLEVEEIEFLDVFLGNEVEQATVRGVEVFEHAPLRNEDPIGRQSFERDALSAGERMIDRNAAGDGNALENQSCAAVALEKALIEDAREDVDAAAERAEDLVDLRTLVFERDEAQARIGERGLMAVPELDRVSSGEDARGADVDVPAVFGAQAPNVFKDSIGERDERACVFKEASARARQGQAPRRALEELHAEPLLKEIDALHERGRCDEERAGSLLKLPALALAMKAPRSR